MVSMSNRLMMEYLDAHIEQVMVERPILSPWQAPPRGNVKLNVDAGKIRIGS